eukprot:12728-Heterococcus_DN1.PRE.1
MLTYIRDLRERSADTSRDSAESCQTRCKCSSQINRLPRPKSETLIWYFAKGSATSHYVAYLLIIS